MVKRILQAAILSFGCLQAVSGDANDISLTQSLIFEASFSDHPQPFSIKVDDEFIQETKQKASQLRVAVDINQDDFVDGVPSRVLQNLSRHWSDEYDWRKVEAAMNKKFKQFTTIVQAGENYTHPIPLHFIHHTSEREDAIPLLFLHGWPGSFHEVAGIIDLLTSPPDPSLPAFHVVAPDLPGFGFSPAPDSLALGYAIWDKLSIISCSNWAIQNTVAPSPDDIARFQNNQTTPEETIMFQFMNDPGLTWTQDYWAIESSVPLQVAIGMTDSPIAWTAWQYMGMRSLSPGYDWGIEELITWSMLNYIQGPYGGLRLYKEAKREGTLAGAFPYVSQPVGVLNYYGDAAYYTPLEWAKRQGNVTFFSKKAPEILGGHFPAHINPRSLAQDCWDFWGNSTISGTEVFFH
uniref:Epoxide hydrolase N-terminal domain-containing protein n=1 Tax=Bionectria ochroleuca TaxID=29856 RepID=A0A8H7N0B7_BIOOC